MLLVEVPLFELADALTEVGLLQEWSTEDRKAVSAALAVVIRAWIAERHV
jgi:hypothetical protein